VKYRKLASGPNKTAGLRILVAHIHHVSVRFDGFSKSTCPEERIAPMYVCSLPQGFQVPPKELHNTVEYEVHSVVSSTYHNEILIYSMNGPFRGESTGLNSGSEMVNGFVMTLPLPGIDSKFQT